MASTTSNVAFSDARSSLQAHTINGSVEFHLQPGTLQELLSENGTLSSQLDTGAGSAGHLRLSNGWMKTQFFSSQLLRISLRFIWRSLTPESYESNAMLGLRKKLRKLKGKEPAPDVSGRISSPAAFLAGVSVSQRTHKVLFLLSKNEPPDDSKDRIGVDIVAIHGLNGDAYTTWQHENGTLWLRDLLLSALPGSRVFTYGYPSELFWSNSVATLRDYSRNLLISLAAVSEGKQRPIIFVCHSLRAIVCKQALVLAHGDDRLYGDILSATSAIVFFGTPHRGSKGADLGKIVGRVVNMCLRASQTAGIPGSIRDDLLTTLGSNSRALSDLAVSSRNRLKNLEIVTFCETETLPELSELVVDQYSAIMEIPREDIISLYANHRTMCRFGGATDDNYSYALNAIKRLARTALSNQEMATKANRTSSNQSLSEAERSCMVLLNSIYLAEYKAELPKPVQGTCSWILSHPAYLTWINTEETRLLWVTGEPGCGITMLSAYLTEHLTLGRATPVRPQVFFFFWDDKVKSQRDANAILRGILYQILQQHRKLIKHVKTRFEIDGPSLANSFPALWELFRKLVADLTSGSVGVIVDAIDECEVRTRNSFLNAVMQLVNEPQDIHRQPQNCIKFLITSRPSLSNAYNLTGVMKNRLLMEQNQSNISEDVKLVIRSKVGEIANKFHCNDETKNYLDQVLYSKSDQSFLWLNMVLHSLEGSPKVSKSLLGISSENREDAGKILRLLIGSWRHLTLMEINTACTIDQEHKSVADVVDDLQLSISSTLQSIVGSFVRIKNVNQGSNADSKVSLIHQSAKEYLTDLSLRSTDKIVQRLAIPLVDAALSISQSCIQYLLLQDFQSDILAPERTSLETSSLTSLPSFPFTDFDTTGSDNPLGLDDHLGLDNFFKDPQNMDEEQCILLAQQYTFFDYSATHWAEHYSVCEGIAQRLVQEAVRQLTASPSCILTNWLKYYWIKNNMECLFPDSFETIEVAAFFNLTMLLPETLEKAGFDSEVRKNRALFWAARMCSLDSIRVLLQHGANPNGIGIDGQTPLTINAQYGHLDAVQILLSEPRTEITLRGKSGRSALSFAAGNGHLEIVEALLDRGAFRPDEQDNTHWTPLFWAVQGDHASIVQSLLKQPLVDINQVDKSGRSVLSWAAGEGSRGSLKVLLRHSSVDLKLKDAKGRSPLSWAAGNGQREVVRTLMHQTGIDKATKDNDLRNAISWACQGGHTDTLRTLLKNECGGEDDVDVDVWTPLLWALFIRSAATVEALLSTRRVQIDRQDSYGRTALIWAASYGYLDVVQLLVSWKASLHLKNRGGQTAADVARLEGQTEVWEFLDGQRDKDAERIVQL
ncbi:ankyrin [Melanomma pulvis-pyrius CBS 109.77]|uniref:Ankyrin n=1 Tax=Melanomma pulvis-pyrius CBS 109.77 TaxID=1314802 RepID=A0A6A6X5U1_9PLEO|nr:ankyrin [Melanomma pulvis-pyrius CBS 109.77]